MTGLVAEDGQFSAAVELILRDPERHARMRRAARQYALGASWDSVFEGVYEAYESVALVARKRLVMRAAL